MLESHTVSQLPHQTRESPWRDTAVVVGITALSLVLSAHFQLSEQLYAATRHWNISRSMNCLSECWC